MFRWFVCGLVVCVALAAASAPTNANGRYPATVEVRIHPSNDDRVLLASTFGLLLSTDGGTVFRWVCEDALGYSGTYDPDYEFGADGAIYLTSFDGLRISRDDGCRFDPHPAFANLLLGDIEVGSDGVVWAAAWSDDVNTGNGLWRSGDDGTTFAKTSLAAGVAWWRSVKVAPSSLLRMYVSGAVLATVDPDAGAADRALLYRSDDAGSTFVALSTAGLSIGSEPAVQVLAIGPSNPDVVFVRVENGASMGDAIYRSVDAGASFSKVLETQGRLEAFLVRASGTQVIAGVGLGGMHLSNDGGATFGNRLSQPLLGCIAERSDGVLLGCGANWEPDLMALGRSTNATDWTSTFRFGQIAEPLQCPAGTPQADSCADSWFDVVCPLGTVAGCPPGPADAGVIDGSPGIDANIVNPPKDRGGCGGCGAALLLMIPFVSRRRA